MQFPFQEIKSAVLVDINTKATSFRTTSIALPYRPRNPKILQRKTHIRHQKIAVRLPQRAFRHRLQPLQVDRPRTDPRPQPQYLGTLFGAQHLLSHAYEGAAAGGLAQTRDHVAAPRVQDGGSRRARGQDGALQEGGGDVVRSVLFLEGGEGAGCQFCGVFEGVCL